MKMCADVAHHIVNVCLFIKGAGRSTPTNAGENGKHRDAAAAKTIISLCKRYAIVCVVILAVWALLTLPTIFYYRPMKVLHACNFSRNECIIN